MSETSSKKSKTKESSATKSDSKAKESTSAKSETKAKDASASKSDSGTKTSDGGSKGEGKSARESVGGATGVHYGYFSSVRTPAYRSGWDQIWGSKNGKKKKASNNNKPAARKSSTRQKPAPIAVSFDIDDLPAELRDGLVEIARGQLKKRRLSYDKHARAGSVDWRIECRIDR